MLKFIKSLNQVGKEDPNNILEKHEWPTWLKYAHHECIDGNGQSPNGVKEVPGPKYHPRIQQYLSSVKGLGVLKLSDETPWCSSFVNFVMGEVGAPRTDSPLARSWMKIGHELAPEEQPEEGDLCVFFSKENDINGHVGFFITYSYDKKRVLVLGGNQGNELCYMWYPISSQKSFLRSIRRIDE